MVAFAGKGLTLSQSAVDAGLDALGIESAAFWAVMAVETRGFGFLPDKRPVILFERHVFHEQTKSKFSAAHPNISNSTAGGYGAGGANQYVRLGQAVALDRRAGLNSASWGLGQVMGFNSATAGFASADAMVAAMADSEDAQVGGMVAFIVDAGLAKHLKKHDWVAFAQRYNGPNFAKNNYHIKLEHSFNRYSVHAQPDLKVRTVQAALLYLGFSPGGVDGFFGIGSQKALMAWEKSRGLPVDGKLSDENFDQLVKEAF